MLFNSLQFVVFFPLVTILYFLLPHRFRWFHLLAASCVFYAAFIPAYILILLFTIVVDYFAGIAIEKAQGRKRRIFLIASLIANIGILGFFKYCNFFIENVNAMLYALHFEVNHIPLLDFILPIGLSFHTFQAMSYTIEVYHGNQRAEKHFGIYALYVMFYPQLVAGPIERPQNLLHQFRERHYFDYDRVCSGLKLMMWGMFKKVVIADRLAVFVNDIYESPTDFEGLPLILATVFFALQIYCDFSGYSDIAIGSARVMGFNLMKNFHMPYFSKTIGEFWKRWHISLSTWFRDYLYIPLGGNKVAASRWYFNLFFVFLVSGLWHGASWNFVLWGALHGTYLIAGIITKPAKERFNNITNIRRYPLLLKSVDVILTFSLVSLAWIFFRATTFQDAWHIVTHLFTTSGFVFQDGLTFFSRSNYSVSLPATTLIMIFVSVALMETIHLIQRKHSPSLIIAGKPIWLRWSAYYALLALIIFGGVFQNSKFIYFQF